MLPGSNLQQKLTNLRRQAEERDAQRRAQKSGHPYIDLSALPINTEALGLISKEIAKKTQIVAVDIKEKKLFIAAADPDSFLVKELTKKLKSQGFEIRLFTASLSGLSRAFDFYRFISERQKQITGKIEIQTDKFLKLKEKLVSVKNFTEALGSIDFLNDELGKIFEIVLFGALVLRASDVHFEPLEDRVKLRIRIDGILHDAFENFGRDFYSRLLSRVKLLSDLKINIRNKPQDGRFSISFPDKKIEVRVAIAPSEFGEVAVMRLLDPEVVNLTLSDLGIREDDLEIIKTELKRPNGMILNAGPTGAGKTTTLYAFLKYKKSPTIKIIAIEDPIEYHLEGIEQTQVDEGAGYTFANGLRSLMRQDPDVILVGEMRDKETAEIGIQAALTGHLVFSTVHANSASGVVPRLLDLGVKPSSIGPALNLIIAQRLVRRLCRFCKSPQETNPELKNKIEKFFDKLPRRVSRDNFKEIKIYQPKGCLKCNNSGYLGRIGIYELLLNDPEYEKLLINPAHRDLSSRKELEDLILAGAPESAIERFALNQEMVTMQQDGILKIISGFTSFEEVESATGSIAWQ
ncbi:MAG: hypothetical protein UU85_C0004G0069 [Candidatus Wolfebacteria bacterium GW2011_GWA2_42_10]|uniref:Bacterial type II secretion system protein E domain-containing protein n=2 Tax=Candidatus Wolfeibacteriota TaxID=1752735 RepID=A0A0G0XK64_9BACT|nr:MAG: hypothetical protein UU38_C0001G0130 [Candidatus Wolfebacteria bacterium GW2011_GWB1_41_12]KKS25310.1 MAG: hypothetical protein UU85_C0004G0069 [Candidatus Wolfebacteria bacterium GW2011_GWA2_42_10]KKT56749.1 MAG: hypothetical protein UW50_C0001G0318 [Candidatus Wolfebacteria bacterium GW2011_GWA1_44_24]